MELIAKTFDRLTTAELYEILKSRCEVFTVGQRIICVDEDGVDFPNTTCMVTRCSGSLRSCIGQIFTPPP